MNAGMKVGSYLLLVLIAIVFGALAYSQYSKLMSETSEHGERPLPDVPALKTQIASNTTSGYAKVLTFGAFFFCSIVGLGLLVGHDVSNFFGNRTVKMLYNEESEGISDPEYEVAEQEWANGNHLEAIRLMRDYLNKNPREQHVAIRIAEIYEKDLNNYLAAALEYEEVLKQKLAPDRWGWAAIHLCNLYFKLNHTDKAVALLRRIDAEFPQTPAAEKARKRLEQMGLATEPTLATAPIETDTSPDQPQIPAPGAPEPQPPSSSKLPPGFLPRKS